jgi:hypothetical protein
MLNYYKKLVVRKAITDILEFTSSLSCDLLLKICYEYNVEKEYREQLLNDWQRYCQHEVWFNIDEPIFLDARIKKLEQFLESK